MFSGVRLDRSVPAEATILSARIALKSAQRISEIAADIMALEWNAAEIASFVGYCNYVSASIHIALICSHDPSLAIPARANLIASLKLLKSMKMYWTNLERLVSKHLLLYHRNMSLILGQWIRVNVLYSAQISRQSTLAEGRHLDRATHLSELDMVAAEAREVGQLTEPLADSVLDYTLQRLKPSDTVQSPAMRPTDPQTLPGELSQLIEEDHSLSLSAPQARSSKTQPGPSATALAQQTHFGNDPQAPSHSDRMRTPGIALTDMTGLDWWEVGLGDIQEPVLPYEDLFNLDFDLP
jgi:hypothetical protein